MKHEKGLTHWELMAVAAEYKSLPQGMDVELVAGKEAKGIQRLRSSKFVACVETHVGRIRSYPLPHQTCTHQRAASHKTMAQEQHAGMMMKADDDDVAVVLLPLVVV